MEWFLVLTLHNGPPPWDNNVTRTALAAARLPSIARMWPWMPECGLVAWVVVWTLRSKSAGLKRTGQWRACRHGRFGDKRWPSGAPTATNPCRDTVAVAAAAAVAPCTAATRWNSRTMVVGGRQALFGRDCAREWGGPRNHGVAQWFLLWSCLLARGDAVKHEIPWPAMVQQLAMQSRTAAAPT
jgi:hypothetical protein